MTKHHNHFTFFSCTYLKEELFLHREKLLKFTKLTPHLLDELEQIVTANISFINEGLIPASHFLKAEYLVKDVDHKDIAFVALSSYVDGILWTGDKKLIEGLSLKGFFQVITTSQLSLLFDEFESR